MKDELIKFLNCIYDNCTDEYGHLQMTKETIKGYENESCEGIVTEYLKINTDVSKNKN